MAKPLWIQDLRILLITAALLSASACSRKDPPPEPPPAWQTFDAIAAFGELENIVTFGSRAYGTEGHAHIARYLQARLKGIGAEARIQTFTKMTARGALTFRNIEAVVKGTGSGIIIVSTHYDSLQDAAPDFQAANSAGSGPAVLLEMARIVSDAYRGGPEIRFVFFDGQEPLARHSAGDGLRGSTHYAEHLVANGEAKRVRGLINLDLVGDRDLTVTIPKNVSNELRKKLLQASHKENARKHFKLFAAEIGDDHEPFYRRRIPAINIIDFEYGSQPGRNDYFRTEQDTIDKVSAESLGIVGRVALRLVRDLAEDGKK